MKLHDHFWLQIYQKPVRFLAAARSLFIHLAKWFLNAMAAGQMRVAIART